MNGASRPMQPRVIFIAAAGTIVGVLSQAHWFDGAPRGPAAAQEFAAVAASPSEPSKTETSAIPDRSRLSNARSSLPRPLATAQKNVLARVASAAKLSPTPGVRYAAKARP
jgi:hypothetical protein